MESQKVNRNYSVKNTVTARTLASKNKRRYRWDNIFFY